MINLNALATRLERFPVAGLRHVRDLIYFDGPLLSLFKHPNGENYLYYWCDCDETANRWMVLRVSEATLLRLTYRIIPLSDVIPGGSLDDYVYLLDIAPDDSKTTYLTTPTNIPGSYRPVVGAFLEPQEVVEDTHSYSFLLQGDWTLDAIGDFPKTFNKVYSTIYGLNVLHMAGYTSHPWQGGFSSMHFFNDAMSEVPRIDKPLIDAIQKSSPGFIRFSLHTQTAEQVVRCVVDFKSKAWTISETVSTLRKDISGYGLNQMDLNSPDWDSLNRRLTMLARQLLSHFGVINVDQFVKMCPRPFEAAKIALAFVRYVQDLMNFEAQGLVEFPRQSSEARS